jgi:hypothetical protein
MLPDKELQARRDDVAAYSYEIIASNMRREFEREMRASSYPKDVTRVATPTKECRAFVAGTDCTVAGVARMAGATIEVVRGWHRGEYKTTVYKHAAWRMRYAAFCLEKIAGNPHYMWRRPLWYYNCICKLVECEYPLDTTCPKS